MLSLTRADLTRPMLSVATDFTNSSATSLYVVRPFFSTVSNTLIANWRRPLPGARRFATSLDLQGRVHTDNQGQQFQLHNVQLQHNNY